MNKKKKIIVGNWKMNPQLPALALKTWNDIKKQALPLVKVTTIICPPFLYLPLLAKGAGKKIQIGSQDIFHEASGSYTGFVSADMVKNAGASFTILGHSERRAQGETDETINKKIHAAIKSGLSPILCVGEKERSQNGEYLAFIQYQLHTALSKVQKKNLESLIIAYEPVWAIGRKDFAAMPPRDLHEMTIYIRKILTDMFDKSSADAVPVLYGGSVNSENARGVLFEGEADGLLVGRQSLDPKDFGEILRIANQK